MDTKLTGKTRIESDLIGAREIPAEASVSYTHLTLPTTPYV